MTSVAPPHASSDAGSSIQPPDPPLAPPPAETPFEVVLPAGTVGPLVFASPHSGRLCPADLGARAGLSRASLRSAEDALVDRLIASGPRHGAPTIAGRISRAYVDLNRGAGELDPELIDGCAGNEVSAKTAAGFGVIPRRAGDGVAMYDRRLDLAEAEARIERVHRPYHAALADLLTRVRAQWGVAILVDWHSMPSRATGGGGRTAPGPDVVLGDRHGASCEARLSRRLRALFEGAGWRVGLNQPYAGGYSTQTWGRPGDGFQAIQIELNRALYLDEATQEPGEGYDRCRAAIERVIAALCAERWTER